MRVHAKNSTSLILRLDYHKLLVEFAAKSLKYAAS